MYKIAVIGDRESILAFSALGIKTVPVDDAPKAAKALHQLAADNYAVIYLTEKLAQELSEELADYATMVAPAIILIPDREGSRGLGLANIDKAVEKAVGSNILE